MVTGDPQLLKEIFAADPTLFSNPADIVRKLVGEHSIVMSNGGRHSRKRKLLMPPFHGARMRSYGEIIQKATRDATTDLPANNVIDVAGFTRRLSLDVMARAVFGIEDHERVEVFQDTITACINGLPAWLMFMPILHRQFGGVGPFASYERHAAKMKDLFREEIAQHNPNGEDVLALLLTARDEDGEPMAEDELLDELRTLIIAGHETTATTLCWALDALHRHPHELERLLRDCAIARTQERPSNWRRCRTWRQCATRCCACTRSCR